MKYNVHCGKNIFMMQVCNGMVVSNCKRKLAIHTSMSFLLHFETCGKNEG